MPQCQRWGLSPFLGLDHLEATDEPVCLLFNFGKADLEIKRYRKTAINIFICVYLRSSVAT
jgi:hypothetical protein